MSTFALSRRDRWALAAAVVLPCGICAALAPLRSAIPNTNAALILVAVIVGVAANGHRVAGVLAAVCSAAAFDYLLTPPYSDFAIKGRSDVETTVLLVVVGAAVTELAVRGRRHRLLAATDEQYLDAIQSTSRMIGAATGSDRLIGHVTRQVQSLLGLRACRFESTHFGGLPRLHPDGRITTGTAGRDLDRFDLPDREVELLVAVRGTTQGRLVLTPDPSRIPPVAALRCAAVLAEQLAAGLAAVSAPGAASARR